jgi:hypothetical protein
MRHLLRWRSVTATADVQPGHPAVGIHRGLPLVGEFVLVHRQLIRTQESGCRHASARGVPSCHRPPVSCASSTEIPAEPGPKPPSRAGSAAARRRASCRQRRCR